MSKIVKQIDVSYRYQVRFTHDLFSKTNLTLRDILSDQAGSRIHRVLVVMDEALRHAQPGLVGEVRTYFEQHNDCLKLVCDPMQFEGERTD